MRWRTDGRLPESICSSGRVNVRRTGAPRLSRQRDAKTAVIAERRLRAEAAAHAVDDHAHLFDRQIESLRQLAPHAGGELGRDVNCDAVVTPVGDQAVRLHAAMRLHLGRILALECDFRDGERLRCVAATRERRSAGVAVERQVRGAGEPSALRRRFRIVDFRCAGLERLVDVDDEWQRFVLDADELQRLFGFRHRSCGDGDNRLADVAHHRARRIVRVHRADNGLDAFEPPHGGQVNRPHLRVR